MSVFSALMSLKKGGILPDEYQQVEYIQSNGSQYIDTGVNGSGVAEYDIKFNPLGTFARNWEQYLAGDIAPTTGIGKIYQVGDGINKLGYYGAYNDTSGGVTLQVDLVDADISFKVKTSDGICVNDTKLYNYNGGDWGTLTFWVFGSHSETSLKSSMKLYSLKMWTNSILVRDFVPCYRKSDSVIGLYDMANNVFYINQGSGSFIKGNDV